MSRLTTSEIMCQRYDDVVDLYISSNGNVGCVSVSEMWLIWAARSMCEADVGGYRNEFIKKGGK